ncbi:MAG: FecR family protein [Thermodesulfobacteriota bacterium]
MLGLVKRLRFLVSILLIVFLCPLNAWAKEVGQFTKVEGKVDLHKKGKPEAIAAQPQTKAEEKDAIKTEAMSRAQIQFLDASTMTVAPQSYVTIESYMYDAKKGELGCLSEIYKGICHIVVSPLAKKEKKEFLVKTPTAIMGIRGTELYILIGPDFTDVFVKEGTVSTQARPAELKKSEAGPGPNPYLATLMRQAEVRGAGWMERVLVHALQATRIWAGRRPMNPIQLTPAQFQTLAALMFRGLPPGLNFGANPGQLLENMSKMLVALGYTPPAPAAPPATTGPTFPGGGGGGGGGGVASPSQ